MNDPSRDYVIGRLLCRTHVLLLHPSSFETTLILTGRDQKILEARRFGTGRLAVIAGCETRRSWDGVGERWYMGNGYF